MGERGRGDQRPQRRRLARLRPAGHHDVPRRPGEVGPEQVPTLLVGPVDQPEREAQRAVGREPGGAPAAVGGVAQRREERLERRRPLQRRQPHLVGGRAGLAQPLHDGVEHARLGGVGLGEGGAVPVGLVGTRSQRGRQVDPPAVEGARRPGGGPGADQRRRPRSRLAAVGPGDVARGEAHHRRGVAAQVPDAGHRGQRRGVRHAEHRAGVRRGEGPQADPVGQVRVEPAQPAFVETLRGEQQVDLQRAAQPADRGEQVREVGLLVQQLGELVDDDEERGQRFEVRAALPGPLVVGDARQVACCPQQFLAPVHLPGQRVLHAVDEPEVVGEVGDDGGHVRRRGEPGERGAALEVDEHQVERRRGVGRDEAEDQGSQQLGLAGARGADAQPVGAHPLLRGLLEVELHRLAVLADPERHAQPLPHRAGPPRGSDVERVRVAVDAEQLEQARRRRTRLVPRGPRCPARREPPGQRLGLRAGQSVRAPEPLDPAGGAAAARPDPLAAAGVVGDDEAQAAPPDQAVDRRAVDVDQGDPGQTVLDEGPVAVVTRRGSDAVRPVEDHDDVGRAGRQRGAAREPGPVGELGREPRLHRRQRGRDHPHRAGAVGQPRVRDVREPLAPLPREPSLAAGGDGEQEVVGPVEGDELGHERPDKRAAALGVGRPGHAHRREGAQRDGGGQGLDDGVGPHEAAQRHRRDRLEVLDGAGLRRDERGREPLVPAADADVREVGIAGTPLPGAGSAGEGHERVRVGVGPLQAGALLGGDRPGAPADLGEVAQVVRALGVGLGTALGPAAGGAAGDHAERRERDHAPEQPRRRVVDADDDDEADRGQQHHQRQQAREQAGGGDAGLGRRGLERDLPRRHRRGGRARPASDDLRAHAPPPAALPRTVRPPTAAGHGSPAFARCGAPPEAILRSRSGDRARSAQVVRVGTGRPGPRGTISGRGVDEHRHRPEAAPGGARAPVVG